MEKEIKNQAEGKSKKEEKKDKQSSGKKSLIWGIVLAIVLAIIIVLVVFGVGIYKYNWHNQYATWMVKVFPYPAAMVDFEIVKYADWQGDVDTLDYYLAKQDELNLGILNIPEGSTVESTVLKKMIKAKLLERLALQYKVKVEQADIDAELEKVYSQAAGGKEEVESTLKELYNWSVDDFARKVIDEFLLREKVQQALDNDEEYSRQAREQIENIKSKIDSNELTFEDAAQIYSQDPATASLSGDLGTFGRGDMVVEFEEAAFSLSEGQISEPVKTSYGYHLIKLDKKTTDAETGEETVSARHILISTKSLDELLEDIYQEAKIYNFVD